MSKKLLSEQCVEYSNFIESFSKIDEKIRRKLLEIVKFHDPFAKTIEFYSFIKDNKTIKVLFKYNYLGFIDLSEYVIPIEWLDLKKIEIRKIIEAEQEAEKKRKKEEEEKELERKERADYERLKAKFDKKKDNNE